MHVIFDECCNYCSTFKLQLKGAALLGIFKIQKYLPPQAIKHKSPSVPLKLIMVMSERAYRCVGNPSMQGQAIVFWDCDY